MLRSKQYVIQFAGLSNGNHEFEIEVGDTFFKNFEYEGLNKGNILVNINMLKRSHMMVLNFNLQGYVVTNCDRCADEFELPVKGEYQLIVKVGDTSISESDDDVIGLSATESKLDLSDHIYEYIVLSLPVKREHVNIEQCNKEVINKLKNILIENETQSADSRWEKLKNIKLN
jgi:uncharacterized metal-binding protein YceD (DUF177 family)